MIEHSNFFNKLLEGFQKTISMQTICECLGIFEDVLRRVHLFLGIEHVLEIPFEECLNANVKVYDRSV